MCMEMHFQGVDEHHLFAYMRHWIEANIKRCWVQKSYRFQLSTMVWLSNRFNVFTITDSIFCTQFLRMIERAASYKKLLLIACTQLIHEPCSKSIVHAPRTLPISLEYGGQHVQNLKLFNKCCFYYGLCLELALNKDEAFEKREWPN